MAQSTTNLGKIHVFPSETLYNQFKDLIADNDLALLKDDGAYIIAALLEQNGYVKFSNGFILQWGKTTKLTYDSVTTITYSLPLATTLYINAFMHGGGRDKCIQLPQILSQTPTSVQMYITWATDNAGYHSPVTWLAIGIQQWGVLNAPAFPDEGQPVTFPIKFSKIPSVITAINQAKNSVSPTQLFTASINTYTTTLNMILHRYGGLTASDARVDWFAWGV